MFRFPRNFDIQTNVLITLNLLATFETFGFRFDSAFKKYPNTFYFDKRIKVLQNDILYKSGSILN